MEFGGSPNEQQPVPSQQSLQAQIHSGRGSRSAWQALQQVARTKPRSAPVVRPLPTPQESGA
jgi:hypothetical protein